MNWSPQKHYQDFLLQYPGAATKRRVISQQPNLFPKPGKHLEREKNVGFPTIPLTGYYSITHGDDFSS